MRAELTIIAVRLEAYCKTSLLQQLLDSHFMQR